MTRMTIPEISEWATWMRVAGQADETINLRTRHVRKTLREIPVPWRLITTDHLIAWLGSQTWAPNTRRAYRASLRLFFAWAQARGMRQDNPAGLIPVTQVPRGLPRPTPDQAYQEALELADERSWLMIQLAAMMGLRRGEISRARREDIHEDLVGYSLRVVGKGGHVRSLWIPPQLVGQLLRCPPGWLFPSPVRPGPLTPAHVGKLVSRLLPAGWTTHTLRHRSATVAYEATKDVFAVQEMLGHAKTDTTRLYTQVSGAAVRAAIAAAAGTIGVRAARSA